MHTHRDSYLIETLSVVSVRRPLLPGSLMFGTGLAGFCLSFGDLLYAHEAIILIAAASASLLAGGQVGHLTLLSRDLRGSELAGAVWGRFSPCKSSAAASCVRSPPRERLRHEPPLRPLIRRDRRHHRALSPVFHLRRDSRVCVAAHTGMVGGSASSASFITVAAVAAFLKAIKAIFGLHGRERVIAEFESLGKPPKSSQMASHAALIRSGTLDE